MARGAERVFILSAILVIGLGLTLVVSRGALAGQGGSNDNTGLLWAMAAALLIIAAIGALWLRSGASATAVDTLPRTAFPVIPLPPEMVVPGLLAGGFVLFLQIFDNGIIQIFVIALAAVSFAGVFWAQMHAVGAGGHYFGLAQVVLNITSHLCAFLLFTMIYWLKARSLFSATAVGVVAFLLVYEMLSRDADWHRVMKLPVEGRRTTITLLSLVAGLVMSQLTWGLNYWAALATLVGGVFLLVAFYVIYGLLSHYVDRRLTRRTMLEFGLVGAVAMLVIFGSAFFTLD